MMTDIKNVVFDLGGVLVDLDLDRCRAAFVQLGMPQVAELISPYHPAEMIGELEAGSISLHQMCDRMRAVAGTSGVSDEQIEWAYGQFLTGVPLEKIRMVGALRQRGIRTYVLSNNNPSSMRFIREMFTADGRTMDDYFDHIYLSYEMKCLKPSEEIFRKMIDDGGMCPEQTLFIDDSKTNVEAAHKLGLAVYMPAPGEDFAHLFDQMTN